MKVQIKPYGTFEIIKMPKRGMANCKECWFGQQHKEPSHCPNHIRCSFKDGTGIVFVKV